MSLLDKLPLTAATARTTEDFVYRLRRTWYRKGSGFCATVELRPVKRLSPKDDEAHDLLSEMVSEFGASEVLPDIINLHKVPEGLYTVSTCNESKDWETGYLDDWDYELVPYKLEQP